MGVEITGLGWCGTRAERAGELPHFYQLVLGLRLVHQEAGLWVFGLPDGRYVEVFGRDYPGKDHFGTGPVVGFAVTDLRPRPLNCAAPVSNCPGTRGQAGSISAAPTARSASLSPAGS